MSQKLLIFTDVKCSAINLNYYFLLDDCNLENNELLYNTSLAAPGALAHRLRRRTACNVALPAKSKMAARGLQNGVRGLERCLPLGFWVF